MRIQGPTFCRFLIVGVVALAFSPVLSADFVNWDDDLNLTENLAYRGFSSPHLHWMFTTFHGGHYQPLTWLSFALDHAVWGMNPVGYHLTNLVLHAINSVLVYHLALTILRRFWPHTLAADLRLAATLGALFFALHPLRVESVAWVTERRDVLSGAFYLLSILAYLRCHDPQTGDRGRLWYLVAVVAFLGSVLSKAWGITVPVVLLILDVVPLRRLGSGKPLSARVIADKLPFVVIAVAAAAAAAHAVTQVEGFRTLAEHGVAARLAQAAYGLCFYLWKTALPFALSPLYPLEPLLDPLTPRYVVAGVIVTAITLWVIRQRRRRPWAVAAWLVYVVIVSPVSGLAQVGPQLVADRYTYIACLPAAMLAAAAAQRWAVGRPLLVAVALAGLGLLGLRTVEQCRIWQDSVTLWTHAIHVDPTNYVAYTNRGIALEHHGQVAAAAADYTASIRLNPAYPPAYLNRGHLFEVYGNWSAAIADYTAALEGPARYAATAYFNRGNVRRARDDLAGAMDDYTASVNADPHYVKAWHNRGWLRHQQGDVQGAASDYERALELASPWWPERERIARALAAVRDAH